MTELRKLKLPNTMLLEQFYLSHKPTTIAGRHYVGADLTAQDEAIEKLEEVFAPILTINKERAVDGVRPSPIQMAEMLRNMADADAEKVWKALQQVTHKE